MVSKVVDLQPDQVEGPGGRAIATAEAAPDILVRVNEEVNVVPVRLFDERFYIVEIGFVVAAGRLVFQRLPCHHQSQKVQTPVLEPQEVLIGFFQRDGTTDEGDVATFVQALGQVGIAEWLGRDLAAAAQVDAVQDARASRFVFEPAAFGL